MINNTDLTYQTLCRDRNFGRQLITFCNRSWQSDDTYKVTPSFWFVAKNKDGKYGIVGGGNNNIGSFIGWCTGLTSWCFNPVNLDDYMWSRINNAFVDKDMPFLHDIHIRYDKQYFYREDSNDEIIEFLESGNLFDKKTLWRK